MLAGVGADTDVAVGQLIQQLLQSALACDSTNAELICTTLMQITNDTVNICNSLIPSVKNLGKTAVCWCSCCIARTYKRVSPSV